MGGAFSFGKDPLFVFYRRKKLKSFISTTFYLLGLDWVVSRSVIQLLIR